MAATDFEGLGVFYLGREGERPVLYPSKHLTTHAVCVGMTGSGKTGLCIDLLEEAALDGIPALVIDPKGDLGNLLLTFDPLDGPALEPWLIEEAKNAQRSISELARDKAKLWNEGLAAWGQDPSRIRRLRETVELALYTPGSESGRPLSILSSFEPPSGPIREDSELFRQRIASTVSGLLALAGIADGSGRGREHLLLSALLQDAWSAEKGLDLPGLIQQIQRPPLAKVGVLDVESFYPSKERFELVLALNQLIASPTFAAWSAGEPLDIQALLYTPEGKPRVSILSIAHLQDAERMFFVTQLLNQLLSWTRSQSGTPSLRALLFMDEIFGFLPPVAAPPSKQPLLTLLKQARAFGVGIVLATQNPVDLDYKGLANAGTWFIGKLQTDRDRSRLLDGLEGAAGAGFDRAGLEQKLTTLKSRHFLLHDVQEPAPIVFESRWTLSYLRGPLNREEIRTLARGRAKPNLAEVAPAASSPVLGEARAPLSPDIRQLFVPLRSDAALCVYRPRVLGITRIKFIDAKNGVDVQRTSVLAAPVGDGAIALDWSQAEPLAIAPEELEETPVENVRFDALASSAQRPKSYEVWKKELATWAFSHQTLELKRSPSTGLLSHPDEAEGAFRLRLDQVGRESRDLAMEALREAYAPKLKRLEQALQRAQTGAAKEDEQARQAKLQTAISFGAVLVGALLGKKAVSAASVGRATTAARGAGRYLKERAEGQRAAESVAELEAQLQRMREELEAELTALGSKIASRSELLEPVTVRPTKARIEVPLVALAWLPYRRGKDGGFEPAF